MKKKYLILPVLLTVCLTVIFPIPGLSKSAEDTAPTKNKQVTNTKQSTERKKAEKRPKNVREVRTSVLPRETSNTLTKRVSLGTAMGLGKHFDVLNLKSNAAIVVDQLNQEVLFEKNANAILPIASITKLMTAMTVLDSHLNLDETLKINDEDVAIYHKSRLVKGTELTRREALLLALMSSENRAAYTLGRNYPGGIDAFMDALNRKAKEIGMSHSSFQDPTGLTSKNVSSPEDLALMVHAASQYPMIREFSTTPEYSKFINNRMQDFISSNRLVRSGNMLIGLQKTGYISEAGRCLVMQAFVNNKPYIMVFLDSQGSQSRFADAVRVKQWIDDQPDVKAMRKLALKGSGSIGSSSLMPSLSNTSTPASQPFSHQTIESLLQNNH
ncbi:serine hydrolase [Polynucleobacter kasalickyi]|uniref:D-alanyl-D-alanine endopeptidase (Penicillin-binding protein 7) n=1 Tax=Polynucleobacter kasalickyi TaxID=1938817 RepID=A0A1W2B268_9BURK|nr:serine hydrolase [Polynucleobacter kasalickyi]SMC66934.1 D-alanyl-D-alanine endopeptidase (penicillin-binding protein 7) [Polynucleobacter kasalickyi]